MYNFINNKKITLILLGLIFFLLVSFFFSINKIYIPFLLTIFFLISKKKIKKILFINLLFIILLLKIFNINLGTNNTLSKLIYEKHFLYGVQNLDSHFTMQHGDLNGFIKGNIEKNLDTKINIKTDNYGFRNDNYSDEFEYFLIGDSFLHQHRIDQKNLINYLLMEEGISAYNGGLPIYDISHYFELLKFFKQKKNYDKKFIMFIYPGNDFLNYGNPKKDYFNFLENDFLIFYIKLRKFFDFHSKIKFLINRFKNKEKKTEDKITSFLVDNKKMYFFNDYMNSHLKEFSLNDKFTSYYNEFIPDLVIIIPTKFDVYCNFLNEVACNENNYIKKINNNKLFKDVKILDATTFLVDKAKRELKNGNFIYDLKDTHLNSTGSKYLSDFLLLEIKK